MIISHRHKFIFLHCRKTAGSALKVALAPYLGPDDVMVGSLDESLRRGVRIPSAMRKRLLRPNAWKSLLGNVLIGGGWPEGVNQGVKKTYRKTLGPSPPHASAAAVRAAFPHEWRHYFRFCVVRNPYEQAVSDYHWRLALGGPPMSFLDFLRENLSDMTVDHREQRWPRNWDIYTIDDAVSVDFVARYERLPVDVSYISKRLGLGDNLVLPVEKRFTADGQRDWRSYYSAAETELAERLFAPELEYFGYSLND